MTTQLEVMTDVRVAVCDRCYGKGSNPSGGIYVAFYPADRTAPGSGQAMDKIYARLVSGGRTPMNGGLNPRFEALRDALEGGDPLQLGRTDPQRVIAAWRKVCASWPQ